LLLAAQQEPHRRARQNPQRMHLLQGAVPAKTSYLVIHAVYYAKLCDLRTSNTTFFNTNNQTAPAATATPSFLNGATSIKLPTPATWHQAYLDDPKTKMILQMVENPSLITKNNLLQIHYNYIIVNPCASRVPLRYPAP
jgi:hypothetical protein